MRILIITNLYPPHVLGGYEIACQNASEGLRARGHEIKVLAGHAPMASYGDPPHVHRVLTLRGFEPTAPHTKELTDVLIYERSVSQYGNTATLLNHLRQFRPDLVYVWYVLGVGGLALLDLLEQVGVPWVMHLMDCVPAHLLGGVNPSVAALFARDNAEIFTRARVISMSRHLVSEITDLTGIRFDIPPEIVPGWVNAVQLGQRVIYSEPRHLRFIAAGSVGLHKGTDLIIEACAQLADEGYKDFTIDIFCLPGAAPEPWIALAAEHGVAAQIRWHIGVTQEKFFVLLPEFDAFLFPTQTREPFGFAPIEAAACGLLPIITRNAGVAEWLVDGLHTLKIDRTPGSLATAMRQMLTGEVDTARIGSSSARFVRKHLSFSRCLNDIERVLHGATKVWDQRRLEEPRLPAILFAKHNLGLHLTAYP